MSIYNNVTSMAKRLQGDFKSLSEFEALQVAARIELAETFQYAFNVDGHVSGNFEKDTALETIAKAIGKLAD